MDRVLATEKRMGVCRRTREGAALWWKADCFKRSRNREGNGAGSVGRERGRGGQRMGSPMPMRGSFNLHASSSEKGL